MLSSVSDDDDDDQPYFRRRFIPGRSNRQGHWEEFDRQKRSWRRLCDRCCEQISSPSKKFCSFHSTNSSSPRIILSISTSTIQSKKTLKQIEKFVKKFSDQVQWTCEDQMDFIDQTTTHLIVENDENSFSTSMTKEVLHACLRHVFIGSIFWIFSSLNKSKLVDYFPFEILRWQNARPDSRGIKQCRFNHLPLFPSSMIIDVECRNGIDELQLTRDDLIEFIELSGATLFDREFHRKDFFVLCYSFNEVEQRQKIEENHQTIFFCKPDFLFHSIIQHEIQSVKNYLW